MTPPAISHVSRFEPTMQTRCGANSFVMGSLEVINILSSKINHVDTPPVINHMQVSLVYS